MQVWGSPGQGLHSFTRGHGHHRAQLGSDVEDGESGDTRKGPGSLMLYHEVNVQLKKTMKFEDVQLKLGLSVQTPSKAA